MNTATAQLNNYRQSPRKVRLVANLIRGKSVEQAIFALQFADKKAALPIGKLLQSAISNAKNLNIDTDTLVIREISVNGGKILYRQMPMARGRAFPIRKRTSKIVLVLGEKLVKGKSAKAVVGAKSDKTEILKEKSNKKEKSAETNKKDAKPAIAAPATEKK